VGREMRVRRRGRDVHEVAAGIQQHLDLLTGFRPIGASAPRRRAQAESADMGARRTESASLHVGNLATIRGG
jgi:hypothetical protein